MTSWHSFSDFVENVTPGNPHSEVLSSFPHNSSLLWLTCYEREEVKQNRLNPSPERASKNELHYEVHINITLYACVRVTGRQANPEDQCDFPATSEG